MLTRDAVSANPRTPPKSNDDRVHTTNRSPVLTRDAVSGIHGSKESTETDRQTERQRNGQNGSRARSATNRRHHTVSYGRHHSARPTRPGPNNGRRSPPPPIRHTAVELAWY
eukprot:scaffold30843_cov50-Phaeocystis_antarctica.AAC.1